MIKVADCQFGEILRESVKNDSGREVDAYIIKRIYEDRIDTQQQENPLREIDTLRLLVERPHSGLLGCHEIVRKDGVIDICMDEGETDLFDEVHRNPLTPETAKQVMRDIVPGLLHLHQVLRRVHMDISPENILRMKDGRYKLMDFGLCRVYYEEHNRATVYGKSFYGPPEIYHRGTFKGPEDVFALGCTLYALLTNSPLIQAAKQECADYRRLCRRVIRQHDNVDAVVESLILDMTHPDPSQRIALEDILQHEWFQ